VAEATERRPSWPLPLHQSARGNAGTALRWFLLSWDSSPCRRCTSRASTPGSRSSRRTGAAGCRFSFRPRGFAPPRRFSPRWSCGSVAPRNRPRVHRVSCVPAGGRPKAASGRDQFPRCNSHPPKSSPRQQPDSHHCDRCLPVVTVLLGGERRPKPVTAPTAIPAGAGGVRPSDQPGDQRAPRGGG
jgi:hypothetical protein